VRIATFNVNGVNGRLPVLLRWLAQAAPDIVCLQELKKFPIAAIRDAGYGAIWNGQKSWNGVAILARGAEPVETQRGLAGEAEDSHSRYIEAAVAGLLIGCLYLPNGNPAPGPKFDYKLRWFDRLTARAAELLASGHPAVLAGDYNVMPTELDVYKPERWVDDALFRPEVRDAYARLVAQGWTDALRAKPSITLLDAAQEERRPRAHENGERARRRGPEWKYEQAEQECDRQRPHNCDMPHRRWFTHDISMVLTRAGQSKLCMICNSL
jgi:exodeoxyribonuclease-3